jgi:hypothetical protein
MTFHALPKLPLTHDRTSDDLSRDPDHSFCAPQRIEAEIPNAEQIGGSGVPRPAG